MFPTAKATSFFSPTIRCGAAKQWAAIFSSSTPCSTSTTSTPAAPPLLPQNNCPNRAFIFSPLFPVILLSLQDSATMLRGGSMSKSRRNFLTQTSLGLLGAAVASSAKVHVHADELAQEPIQLPPGAPSAFGTGPAVGPEVSPATFAEAEKLVQLKLSTPDRNLAAETWRVNLA